MALSPGALGIPQNLPKAEEVIERFIAVTGGMAAHRQLSNQLARGSVEFVGTGVQGTMEVYKARPNKAHKVMRLEGVGTIAQGCDGKVVWERSPADGPKVLSGQEAAVALRESAFFTRIHWKELYPKVICIGEESIEDQDCYKVILTPRVGNPVTHYYAKGSGLLIKAFVVVRGSAGELTQESFLGDYREVEGILLHHSIRQRITGKDLRQEISITFNFVRFNVDLPKGIFDLPEDIKVLAERAKIPQ